MHEAFPSYTRRVCIVITPLGDTRSPALDRARHFLAITRKWVADGPNQLRIIRNQGLGLEVFGEPLHGVRLLGGAMFLNPILTKTQGGATDGWIAPFSPLFNLNLSGEWDLPFVPV